MVAAVRIPGRRLFCALALCALVGACGSSSSASSTADNATQVKHTLTTVFHALASGDGKTLCSLATPQGRQRLAAALPHTSCAGIVKLVTAHLSHAQKAALASIQIKKVTVHGSVATVSDTAITSTRGSLAGFIQPGSAPTTLTKQPDGSWKISG